MKGQTRICQSSSASWCLKKQTRGPWQPCQGIRQVLMYVQEEHVVEEHVIANVRAADLNYQ